MERSCDAKKPPVDIVDPDLFAGLEKLFPELNDFNVSTVEKLLSGNKFMSNVIVSNIGLNSGLPRATQFDSLVDSQAIVPPSLNGSKTIGFLKVLRIEKILKISPIFFSMAPIFTNKDVSSSC